MIFDSSAVRRLRARLADESGFTMAELLSGIVIATVVMSAAIVLVILSLRFSLRVSDKVNSAAESRNSLTAITQRLRSQTCLYAGEYKINGSTDDTAGQSSIVFAGPTEVVYLADLGNANGTTGVTGSVGFLPYLRYMWITDAGADGRSTRINEGWRIPTTTTSPYNFTINPSTSTTLDSLATTAGLAASGPSFQTTIVQGVTQAVSGATSLPYFQYTDSSGTAVPYTNNSIPTSLTGNISTISVNYKILGQSGIDKAYGGASGTTAVDDRTATVAADIPLRVSPQACG